jgi:hypothetical protein
MCDVTSYVTPTMSSLTEIELLEKFIT